MTETAALVEGHYGSDAIFEKILAALAADGIDTETLTPEALAPIDQFHTGGLEATRRLASLVDIGPETVVLDIGSGLGGPARLLAHTYGCRVIGIDLTEAFCRTATMLSERCGLTALTRFEKANALALPFADASFDLAWAQNMTMNIEDKPRFFAEVARVVRPGGRLAMQEMAAGAGGAPYYPLPWAREPSISFLESPETLSRLVAAAGFRVVELIDDSKAVIEGAAGAAGRRRLGRLGVPVFMGPDFPTWSANNVRSMAEGRLVAIRLLAERTG